MNAVAEMPARAALPASVQNLQLAITDVLQHGILVQEVKKAVMKKDVHFGKIPGTPKDTLYKSGAEQLCMVFRIAPSYAVEDLSDGDVIRYRVTCTGTHQVTGLVLGSALGEASGGEEKYKWRKPVCDEEFEETPTHLRRQKWMKGWDNKPPYKQKQIRTEPADAANTILKMATKRAHVAMVLAVLAASDIFGQDLEDMERNLRDHIVETEGAEGAQDQGQQQQGQQQGAQNGGGGLQPWPDDSLENRFPTWRMHLSLGKTHDDVIGFAESKGTLSAAQIAKIKALKPLTPEELAAAQQKAAAAAAAAAGTTPAAATDTGVTDVVAKPATGTGEVITVTYAMVADKIVKAENLDQLADAGTLIGEVADAEQRAELTTKFEQREATLKGE